MKRVPIFLNKRDLKELLVMCQEGHKSPNREDIRLRLEEELAQLEENEEHSKMFKEDEDGFESLTDYGREAGVEKYGNRDE